MSLPLLRSALFDAPTTSNEARKEIIATLVESIVVEECTAEQVVVRIIWVDGEPDRVLRVPPRAHTHRVIAELAATGLGPSGIARRLNAMGLTTANGFPWGPATVAPVLRKVREEVSARPCRGAAHR